MSNYLIDYADKDYPLFSQLVFAINRAKTAIAPVVKSTHPQIKILGCSYDVQTETIEINVKDEEFLLIEKLNKKIRILNKKIVRLKKRKTR